MKIQRLLIAIPTVDYIHFRFVESLSKLQKHLGALDIDYDAAFQSGTLVHLNRDALARKAWLNGYSHALWLDADMVFEPAAFDALVEADRDICCGVFRGRHDGELKLAMYSSFKPPVRMEALPDTNEPFEIAGCGFAFVLMRWEVLEDVLKNNDASGFRPTASLSEDLAFCDRAAKRGWEIYCQPKAHVGHIGQIVIGADKSLTPV